MSRRVVAAAALALGFAFVTFVAVFLEPTMGFASLADFLDPAKVAAGYASAAWTTADFVYLLLPVAFWTLAHTSEDDLCLWSGALVGALFLLLGAIDRLGIQLHGLVEDRDAMLSALAALLPIRFAILKAVVLLLGVFAWRTTRSGWGAGVADKAWRGLGYLVLLVGIAFMFASVPAPLVVTVWAAGLTVREVRMPSAA